MESAIVTKRHLIYVMWRPIPLFFLIYLGICSFNNSNIFAYFMLSKEPYTYMERENNSCGNIYVNSTLIANSTIEPWTIILLVLASRCRIFISLTHCKYMYGKYHEIVVFLKYHEKLYFWKYFYTGLSVQTTVCMIFQKYNWNTIYRRHALNRAKMTPTT